MRHAAPRGAIYGAAAVLLASLALFPFGTMQTRLLETAVRPWLQADPDAKVVAVREGLTETVIYFRREMMARPVSYAMLTNAFSMSATGYGARRYMKLYVYWPMALHPSLKRALLIGYGVGNTAKAMTDSKTLETIDVVDLSRDILQMGRVVYPVAADHPLNDPRVRVHIEDGRYLLQTTDRLFDLITGEPPPPGIAGVENLYTREYFELLRRRLADGGFVTYWLPLSDLTDVSTKAILRAFCDVFEDCSLWNGSGTHRRWQAAAMPGPGVRRGVRTPMEVAGRRSRDGTAWRRAAEATGCALHRRRRILRTLIGDSPALTDDDPKPIEMPFSPQEAQDGFLRRFTDAGAAERRFQESPLIARLWPERLRAASGHSPVPARDQRAYVRRPAGSLERHSGRPSRPDRRPLNAPVLWRLGSNADIQRVLASATPQELENPLLQLHLGIRQLSERRFADAAETFSRAAQATSPAATTPGGASTGDNAFALHVYALCMAGQTLGGAGSDPRAVEESLRQRGLDAASAAHETLPPFWVWMKETFGIDPRT